MGFGPRGADVPPRGGTLSSILSAASRDPANAPGLLSRQAPEDMNKQVQSLQSFDSLRAIAMLHMRWGDNPIVDDLFRERVVNLNDQLDSLKTSRGAEVRSLGLPEDELDQPSYSLALPQRSKPVVPPFGNVYEQPLHQWGSPAPVAPAGEHGQGVQQQLNRAPAAGGNGNSSSKGTPPSRPLPPSSTSLWQLTEEEEVAIPPNAEEVAAAASWHQAPLRQPRGPRGMSPGRSYPPSSSTLWQLAEEEGAGNEDQERHEDAKEEQLSGDRHTDQLQQVPLAFHSGYVVKNTFIESADADASAPSRSGLSAALFRSEPHRGSVQRM